MSKKTKILSAYDLLTDSGQRPVHQLKNGLLEILFNLAIHCEVKSDPDLRHAVDTLYLYYEFLKATE